MSNKPGSKREQKIRIHIRKPCTQPYCPLCKLIVERNVHRDLRHKLAMDLNFLEPKTFVFEVDDLQVWQLELMDRVIETGWRKSDKLRKNRKIS